MYLPDTACNVVPYPNEMFRLEYAAIPGSPKDLDMFYNSG